MPDIKLDLVTDNLVLDSSKASFTVEGFMNVPAILARTGLQLYSTDEEFLKPMLKEFPAHLQSPGKIVKMLRPANEVFAADSISSIIHKPVTNNHPPKNISAKDAKEFIVGVALDACKDEENIKGQLVIYDAKTIEDIKGGKKEISLGYSSDWNMESGIDDSYGEYDGVMKNIRANHVAIVASGRAGKTVRIQDRKGNEKMAERNIGNVKLEIADDKVGVIDALILDAEKAKKELGESTTAIAELKKVIDTLTAERDTLAVKVNDSVITPEILDKAVKERTDLVTKATKLCAKMVTDSKSNLDIMRDTVIERTKIDCADKSEDYIRAAFDTLCAATVSDSAVIAAALSDADKSKKPVTVSDARAKFMADNKTAFEADKGSK